MFFLKIFFICKLVCTGICHTVKHVVHLYNMLYKYTTRGDVVHISPDTLLELIDSFGAKFRGNTECYRYIEVVFEIFF